VVLFDPLSHEVHTKLGECYYGMAANYKDGVCKEFSGEGLMGMARRHFSEALNLKRGNLRALIGLRMSSRETALRPAKISNNKSSSALVDGTVDDIEVAHKLHEFACEEVRLDEERSDELITPPQAAKITHARTSVQEYDSTVTTAIILTRHPNL